MSASRRPKSLAGPTLLLIVLLADAGLIVLGWHLRQQRLSELSLPGLNLASTPVPVPAPSPGPSAARSARPAPAVISGPPGSVIQERISPSPAASGRPGSGAPLSWMAPAVRAFDALRKSERFRDSKVMLEWKRDFLAYPDLAAVNRRYKNDADAARFLHDMVLSPNFRKLTRKYLGTPDVQAFAKALASKPEVLAAARGLSGDGAIMGALRSLALPGLPSLDALSELGKSLSGPGVSAASRAIRQMKDNPSLKGMLEEPRQDPFRPQGKK